MCVEKPSSAAAVASMRPSWPPPRMPIVMPGATGAGSLIVGRMFLDAGGLVYAPVFKPGGECFVAEGQYGGSEQGGVDGAGAPDRKGADRHASRHLDNRQEAVLAAEG